MKNRRAFCPTALGTLEVRITPSSLGLDAPTQVLAHHTAGHEAHTLHATGTHHVRGHSTPGHGTGTSQHGRR